MGESKCFEKYEGVKCFRVNPSNVCDFMEAFCPDLYVYFTYDELEMSRRIIGESALIEDE